MTDDAIYLILIMLGTLGGLYLGGRKR